MNSIAVQNAINRRAGGGQQAPQLASVAPGTAMASGSLPTPMPASAMTKSSAMPSTPKAPSQKFQPQNQSDQIVMALTEQLKGNNALDKEKLKVAQGQSIQPPPPATPSYNQAPPQNTGQGVFGAPSMPTSAMQGGNPLSSGGQSPF